MFEYIPCTPESADHPPILPPNGQIDAFRRFQEMGPSGLSDAELLAWLLGPGEPVDPVVAARELLSRFGHLSQMAAVRASVVATTPGVGPNLALRLSAGLELGNRALGSVERSGILVQKPEDLHPLLIDSFRGLDRERFLTLYLDTRHRVLDMETVSIGSLNASLVHPREVFKTAVGMSAAAIIVAHNHPSGCSQPSGDDLELTARLADCGRLMGIALLDHLVVGHEEIVSIREFGWPGGQEGNF